MSQRHIRFLLQGHLAPTLKVLSIVVDAVVTAVGGDELSQFRSSSCVCCLSFSHSL